VGTVDINLDGSATPTTFPPQTDGPAVVTFTPETSAAPEPGGVLLLGTGLAVMIGGIRGRTRASHL